MSVESIKKLDDELLNIRKKAISMSSSTENLKDLNYSKFLKYKEVLDKYSSSKKTGFETKNGSKNYKTGHNQSSQKKYPSIAYDSNLYRHNNNLLREKSFKSISSASDRYFLDNKINRVVGSDGSIKNTKCIDSSQRIDSYNSYSANDLRSMSSDPALLGDIYNSSNPSNKHIQKPKIRTSPRKYASHINSKKKSNNSFIFSPQVKSNQKRKLNKLENFIVFSDTNMPKNKENPQKSSYFESYTPYTSKYRGSRRNNNAQKNLNDYKINFLQETTKESPEKYTNTKNSETFPNYVSNPFSLRHESTKILNQKLPDTKKIFISNLNIPQNVQSNHLSEANNDGYFSYDDLVIGSQNSISINSDPRMISFYCTNNQELKDINDLKSDQTLESWPENGDFDSNHQSYLSKHVSFGIDSNHTNSFNRSNNNVFSDNQDIAQNINRLLQEKEILRDEIKNLEMRKQRSSLNVNQILNPNRYMKKTFSKKFFSAQNKKINGLDITSSINDSEILVKLIDGENLNNSKPEVRNLKSINLNTTNKMTNYSNSNSEFRFQQNPFNSGRVPVKAF